MSYLALYRKYRPYVFADVVGQEHVVRTLRNQIESNRIAHAYLFCGSRGTGKTSIAKIFARAVNCENPIDGSACGECETCKKIQSSADMNIIEIDAASHNGVDSIREINDEVVYAPATGKYKVYIIDEVHMLSTGAFNALLKTLEEPPAHVIFILATTDPQKIPVTIISRCQRYDFKRIPASEIEETLAKYMAAENVDIDEDALRYIARLADGGMRDALSILEQCVSFYYGEHISFEKVEYIVGASDNTVLFDMLDALNNHDTNKALKICYEVNNSGRNLMQFVTDLITQCRNLLVAKTTTEQIALDYSQEYIERLVQQAESIEANELIRYITNLANLENELKTSISPKVLLEITIVKMCELQMDNSSGANSVDKMMAMIDKLQKEVADLKKNASSLVAAPAAPTRQVQKEIIPTKLAEAVPEETKEIVARWPEILNWIANDNRGAWAFLSNCQLEYNEGNMLYLIYKEGFLKSAERFTADVHKAIGAIMGKEVRIKPILNREFETMALNTYGTAEPESEEGKHVHGVVNDIQKVLGFEIDYQA